jgi:hypothetical protein
MRIFFPSGDFLIKYSSILYEWLFPDGFIEPAAASFDDINDDCLLLTLSYLSFEDLNSVAICNQQCRNVRDNEKLYQTRSGTIVCRRN